MDEKLFRCRVSTCDTCWNGCQTRTATFPVEDWTSLYWYTTLTSSVFLYTDGVHQRVEGGEGGFLVVRHLCRKVVRAEVSHLTLISLSDPSCMETNKPNFLKEVLYIHRLTFWSKWTKGF